MSSLCNNFFFFSLGEFSELCTELCWYLDTIKDVRRLWTCFQTISPWKYLGRHGNVFFFSTPLPLRSLLSVSNSPLQTQLTNPALVPCASLFATRRTHWVEGWGGGGVLADIAPTKGNLEKRRRMESQVETWRSSYVQKDKRKMPHFHAKLNLH